MAVDGVTAAGKTTIADELGRRLAAARLSIDDFHRPPPHEYYPDSFDFRRFRDGVAAIGENAVVDGVFLLHPDLRDLWQLSVFLHVDRQVGLERALRAGRVGDGERARALRDTSVTRAERDSPWCQSPRSRDEAVTRPSGLVRRRLLVDSVA